nr:MAG TPA: hypothetical protein [Caudoviricetes sp.]
MDDRTVASTRFPNHHFPPFYAPPVLGAPHKRLRERAYRHNSIMTACGGILRAVAICGAQMG